MIIKNPIKKNLMKSRNHYNGRYLMVSNLIKLYNYEPKNFEQLITYAVKGYAMNKINIRDAALEIIITLYKNEGDKIHEYFQKESNQLASFKRTASHRYGQTYPEFSEQRKVVSYT